MFTFKNSHTFIMSYKYGSIAFYVCDDPIGTCLFHYGEWADQEFDVISKLVNPNSNCIDIGANIGTHSIWLSKKCYNGYIYSIEPQFYIFRLLNTNLVLNDCTNSIPIRSLVMNSDERSLRISSLLIPPENGRINFGEFNIGRYPPSPDGFETPITKLDNLDLLGRKINFIKIDSEGFEHNIVLSGEKLLKTDKPHMYLEFNGKTGNDDLLYVLNDLGYKCYWHVYTKFNPNNFFNKKENIWVYEDQKPNLELLDKFYEGNMICIHKDHDLEFDEKILPGDNVVKYLMKNKLISEN